MRLRNNPFVLMLLLTLGLTLVAFAQNPSPPSQMPNHPLAKDEDEANPVPPAPNQPGDTVQVPSGQPSQQGVEQGANGTFTFKKKVEEVVLHATVVDQKQRLVTGLRQGDFSVFEDGRPMPITSFRQEDIPVAIGIVIDNSGSMRDKRQKVNQAAINLVRASNPQDEVFVVNFNDEYYLDQDFTSDLSRLREGLDHIESRGGTALYDAVVASADHLTRGARLEKKVLLVVTDGEDNASRESLEQCLRRLQDLNGPTVYSIGILGDDREAHRAKRALNALAVQSGGVAFFPKDLNEVDNITRQVAHDIRNQYTIGYKPTDPNRTGYRSVRVEAHAPGYKHLVVRTRSGYYAGQERASR
jgi:Ca-activated chloride channel family protein